MYTEKLRVAFDSTTPVSLASNAVIKKYAFFRPAIIRRVGVGITTTCNSTGVVVVAVKKYPTMGSNASAVTLATLNIPATSAAGKVIYIPLASAQKLIEGDELVFEVTTAATTAGVGVCMFDADDNPEMPANNSDMVLSA